MKVGIRTPNIKKSIKARTTGKMKRSVKKAVNPLHGKKGMGYINDPKKAVYNKVYNKTTVGVSDIVKTSSKRNVKQSAPKQITNKSISATTKRHNNISNGLATFLIFISILLVLFGIVLLIISPIGGILAIAFGIYCAIYANKKRNK